MKSLMIEDLSLSHALDRKAMAAVHGGISLGGCVPPYFPLDVAQAAATAATAAVSPFWESSQSAGSCL